jgi:hypothetical protein
MALDPSIRTENYPWAASPRFGALAYMSPIRSWPSVKSLTRGYGLYNQQFAPGMHSFYYPRTGRGLGTVNTLHSLGKERIHPKAADALLDRAKGLGMTDPNVIRYNPGEEQISVNNRPDIPVQSLGYSVPQKPDRFLPPIMTAQGALRENPQQVNMSRLVQGVTSPQTNREYYGPTTGIQLVDTIVANIMKQKEKDGE